MCARWVTESVIEKRLHRGGNRGVYGGAGVVIEIDALGLHLNLPETAFDLATTNTEKEYLVVSACVATLSMRLPVFDVLPRAGPLRSIAPFLGAARGSW